MILVSITLCVTFPRRTILLLRRELATYPVVLSVQKPAAEMESGEGGEAKVRRRDSPLEKGREYNHKDVGAYNREVDLQALAALPFSDKREAVLFHRA